MTPIKVVVNGQHMSWYDRPPKIAADSKEFIPFQFMLSNDWLGQVVTAQFSQKGATYNRVLYNGTCYLPAEIEEGPATVSVFGEVPGGVTMGTTMPLPFRVNPSGFVGNGKEDIPPTPSLYAQLLQKINTAAINAVPQIRNNTWWVYNPATGEYEDTGVLVGDSCTQYGLPVLALTGSMDGMTKENKVSLGYSFQNRKGSLTGKWQGSSSLSYPKKNFTFEFDEAFEAKEGWGVQKKYCAKANFIDPTHARNIVAARIWGDIVRSRTFTSLDSEGNRWDTSLVIGLVNSSGADMTHLFSIENENEIVNSGSVYNEGYLFYDGVTLPAGTYSFKFELCWDKEITNDSLVYFSVEGRSEIIGSIKPVDWWTSPTAGTWYEVIFTDVEVPEGRVSLMSTHPDHSPIRFRNFSAIRKEDSEGVNSSGGIENLLKTPNGGAIDGFPIVITLNGGFYGLYTFNIPKDGWMFGMGSSPASEAVVCADAHCQATRFKELATMDGDFDLEYVADEDNSDWVLTSLNNLIQAVIDSDGTDLDTKLSELIDWDSVIDYLIHVALIGGADMTSKNYLLATYNGTKWCISAYDMDSIWGRWWDGTGFHAPNANLSIADVASSNRLYELAFNYKRERVIERYWELRNNLLSPESVAARLWNFTNPIASNVFLEDVARWPTILGSAVSDVSQILFWYDRRCSYMDDHVTKVIPNL